MFLQDIKEIEDRNPRYFRGKYYRYYFSINRNERFDLSIEPGTLPKGLEKEVRSSFDSRLNKDGKKFSKKKILVATDFSEASRNATRWGMELAARLDARLILFNAYRQVPVPVVDSLVVVTPQDMKTVVQEQLEWEVDEMRTEDMLPIEILSKEGPSVETILDAAGETDATLIVVGMKGSHKTFRRLLGSTVTALAKKTTVPLLIVPDNIIFNSQRADSLMNDIAPGTDEGLLEVLKAIELWHDHRMLHKSSTKNAIINAKTPLLILPDISGRE
jgi:nucleotide-binding universal stress UspA family protein